MMWSTYKALSAGVVQPEDVRVYEQEIHQAISEMVSSQMRIAALDDALFQRVTPLISEAIRMGGDTFLALSAATQDLSNDQPLLDCNRSALALIKRVPIELSNLLRS